MYTQTHRKPIFTLHYCVRPIALDLEKVWSKGKKYPLAATNSCHGIRLEFLECLHFSKAFAILDQFRLYGEFEF